MDYGYQRLQRQVSRLERELRDLRRGRYRDRASAQRYFQVRALWARRKALLDASAPVRARAA